jgi:[ribosomal protein S18]-alanine N-acetyltransferase
VIIRPLQPDDLGDVAAIEQEAMVHPWSAAQIEAEQVLAHSMGMAAFLDGRLVGYAMFRICRPECELLRLVVDEQWRRRGVGRTLLDYSLRGLMEQGCTTCFLEVRAANRAAIHVYRTTGFFQIGLRKKYYTQPSEDALQFRADLINRFGEK